MLDRLIGKQLSVAGPQVEVIARRLVALLDEMLEMLCPTGVHANHAAHAPRPPMHPNHLERAEGYLRSIGLDADADCIRAHSNGLAEVYQVLYAVSDGVVSQPSDPELNRIVTSFEGRVHAMASFLSSLRAGLAKDDIKEANWLTVTQAARLFMDDFPGTALETARSRVSRACTEGKIKHNGKQRNARRIEPGSFAQYRLKARNADLDKES